VIVRFIAGGETAEAGDATAPRSAMATRALQVMMASLLVIRVENRRTKNRN
jgi:hypothetical protein